MDRMLKCFHADLLFLLRPHLDRRCFCPNADPTVQNHSTASSLFSSSSPTDSNPKRKKNSFRSPSPSTKKQNNLLEEAPKFPQAKSPQAISLCYESVRHHAASARGGFLAIALCLFYFTGKRFPRLGCGVMSLGCLASLRLHLLIRLQLRLTPTFLSPIGLFFGEPRLSVDALFTSKAGYSSLSLKGSPYWHIGSLLPSSFGRPSLHDHRNLSNPWRAYLDLPLNISYPKFTTKPEWWWRTLSCIPYLMALQISDTAFYFVLRMGHHEQFECLSYYVPGAIRRLPSWFLMVYCFVIYFGVVRSRKWPHFFRHHTIMRLLLENCIQITWYASNFLPLIHYNGTFGLYYWAGVGLMFILLLLECVGRALAGKYVNLPLVHQQRGLHSHSVR